MMDIFKRVGITSLLTGMALLIGQAYAGTPAPSPPEPRPPWGLEIVYAIPIEGNPDYTHIIGLDWEDNTEPTIYGYNVYEKAYNHGPLRRTYFTSKSKKDSILINMREFEHYKWQVTAIDIYGQESEPSNAAIYPSQSSGPQEIAQTKVIGSQIALNISPNPIKGIADMRYEIRDRGWVSLGVYDVTGKLIERLVNKRMNPGIYHIEWTPENIENGVYFVNLRTGSLTRTVKVVVAR